LANFKFWENMICLPVPCKFGVISE
jgi:hypothetical protein